MGWNLTNSSNTTCSIKVDWDVGYQNDVFKAVVKQLRDIKTLPDCCQACVNNAACVMSSLAPHWWPPADAGCYLKTGQGKGYYRPGVTAMLVAGRHPAPSSELPSQTMQYTLTLWLADWVASATIGCLFVCALRTPSTRQSALGQGFLEAAATPPAAETDVDVTAGPLADRSMAAIIARYARCRARQKLRIQLAVSRIGFAFLAFSLVSTVVVQSIDSIESLKSEGGVLAPWRPFQLLYSVLEWERVGESLCTIVGGMLIASSDRAPEDLLSRHVLNFFFVSSLVSLLLGINSYTSICYSLYWSTGRLGNYTLAYVPSMLIVAFYLAMQKWIHRNTRNAAGGCMPVFTMTGSDIFLMYLVVSNVNRGFFLLRLATASPGNMSYSMIASSAMVFSTVFVMLALLRKYGRRAQSFWYIWVCDHGLSAIILAYQFYCPCDGPQYRVAGYLGFTIVNLIVAIAWLCLWSGRHAYFRVVSRIFARQHRTQDAAFIAALIDDHRTDVPAAQNMLIARAHSKLRRIRFSNLSLDLLQNSLGTDSAAFDLSEPCEPGQIDYFISHSWKDNATLKYAQLTRIAEAFQRQHGRECTFWFDKVCINQRDIAEDLKCLPIFVMGCSKLLILYGDSYLSRLWCIWELYVFFATSVDADQVLLQPIGNMNVVAIANELARFRVATATCYLKQDEDKLRSVIRAGGEDHFNQTIRNLAQVVKSVNQEHLSI